ncbi:MAG: type II toxin-antitoxin system VapC family toxin [Gemmatimonadota bacterium]|nr:type II toxin-antitoxin system VapC family toxin [Gemmatimonadota bacterium]MDH3423172.1 type II toxin-antitoxin system VapC family toxin [Gemmatimonadota bacterium]
MIFVDSNIPMYLVGAEHPHKADAKRLLERHIAAADRLVTDAEVFHEILHRYVAIRRREAIDAAFEALVGIADEVLPIELQDVHAARASLRAHPGLSARDALHVAIMHRHGVTRIMSFDAGFDAVEGIERIR